VPSNGSAPALHLNPGDDQVFAAAVARVLASGLRDAGLVQQRLRVEYPDALVRPRDLAAEPYVVWYVYRDGRWVHRDGAGDQDHIPGTQRTGS
jgi:hypothetical protein